MVESIDGHKRGVGEASLTNFQYHLKLQGYPTHMSIDVMSTPSLNAEKWLLPTVLLYWRRTLQHLTPPRGNLFLSPRMSHSTLTGLCLVLFLALLSSRFRLSNHWCRPCAIGSINCLVMLLLEYIFRCNHLMACPVRVPRTKNLYLRPSWWSVYLAPCAFLVDFPVFWILAQRSVIVPQLSLSTVLVWLVP